VTDVNLVLAKLAALNEQVARMERRRASDLEAFRQDVDRQDALAMSLLVALQEAADIALHVASDAGWGVAPSYAESFQRLAQHGVIEASLAASLATIASLRNRVAHGYATMDFERLWRETPLGIEAFRQYAAQVASFLAGASPGAT
jgi:uncharacterized protein YutE (UPF0331/DUF86 family)